MDTPWHNVTDTGSQVTPERWLLKYMEAGIDCVVVTDHNSGAWIDKLKLGYQRLKAEQPAGFRELHLFPGVEISVNGGFHLLVIFDQAATTSDIDTLLGRVEYQGTKGDSDGVTRKSPVQVIEAVAAAGGLAIPAHADQAKGLLELDGSGGAKAALDANTLRQIFDCGRVLAMEVVDRAAQKPQVYVDSKCGWSEVWGSDCENFRAGHLPGSRYTWVKMAKPSLEGLRLGLLDGAGFSIRRSDDPEPFDPFNVPTHFVESIEVSDARYMGRGQPERLEFSPWFNALVGGRGTGKSTVVHALRLACRRDGELKTLSADNEARRTFERFVQEPQSRNDEYGALDYRSGRKTEILVTMVREGVRHRLRWRQDASGTAVEECVNGSWRPSVSQSITAERFAVRIFSQGQIAALAGESQEALLAVIDEAARSQSARQALENSVQRFFALRAQVRELDGKLKGRDELQVSLDDVRRKLAGFEGKEHAEILKTYQLRSRQDREMERQVDHAVQMAVRLREEAEGLSAENVPPGLFDPQDAADREALAAVERLHAAVAEAAVAVREAGERLEMIATREREELATSAWREAFVQATRKYTELVEELKEQGVADPSEYGKLVQERQRLEGEIARLEALQKERDKLVAEATLQRQRVRQVRQALSKMRHDFLANTLAQNPYVRIELLPYGRDARMIERGLREVLGVTDDRFSEDILVVEDDGTRKGLIADLIEEPSATAIIEQRLDAISERFGKACAGRGDFGGHFNNYLQRECAKRPELLDRLLVWSPEDSLRVEYSPRGDGTDFRPMGQASAGQRAAAMLAFLLAHGQEPLVLDQPEDDLDNHLIYDLVVRQIRANKLRRQIVVVTHNANIVVNGDAEMLHALDFRGGQCRVVQAGSLQEQAMREEVCRVMEGGREAFERRYRRLGRES
jgi:DNA repair ATPase RecN